MEFRVLGPMEVVVEGPSVDLGGTRERAVLASLLLSANQVVSVDRLVDDLWGDRPPETAIPTLRVFVSRLRKTLRQAGAEEIIVTHPPGYLARIDPSALDLTRFEALAAQGHAQLAAGDAAAASATLREALGLWRGPALADVADFPFARTAATRLDEQRLAALEECAEADLACGRHRQLVPELEALTATYPLRERLWAHRMVALYRSGRQVDALRSYQDLRRILADDLGLEPTTALRDLETAILRQDPALVEAPSREVPVSGPQKPFQISEIRSQPIPMPALLTDMGRIFVGRDSELERLSELWKGAVAGERRVALLAGEPGIGKTRLAAELAIRVRQQGALLLAGRCDEDLGVPYQPFVEAFRHFVDHTPSAELKERLGRYGGELVRLVPELTGRVRDLPPALQSDPETERYRLFDAVAAWLAAVSNDTPLLLVLDDLQWAAKPTLLLLRHVARAFEARRLLLLGIYRDTELTDDHPLVELVADLRRQDVVERLPLSGLDDVAVGAIVEQAAGQALDDDGVALARAIYRETEGNPFFVREVLRHLVETNAIERHGGRWRSRMPIEQLGIPEGIRDVIGRRLSRLSAPANQALRIAAVIGPEFDTHLLQAAGQFVESELLAALDEAVAARLVSEVSPARFRFSHALVRATLNESLTGARKVVLHRHVAEAIEALYERRLDDYLPALAHHFYTAGLAGDPVRAFEYSVRAGEQAGTRLAHEQAAGCYTMALEAVGWLGGGREAERMKVLLSRAEAWRCAGEPDRARHDFLAVGDLAEHQKDSEVLARAALGLGEVAAVWGSEPALVARLEHALQLVEGTQPALRARLLARLGQAVFYSDADRCLELSAQAVRQARRAGDPAALAAVLRARHVALAGPDHLGERKDVAGEIVDLARVVGEPELALHGHAWRMLDLLELGDIEGADHELDAVAELAVSLRQPLHLRDVAVWRGMRALLDGRFDEVERRIAEARTSGTQAGDSSVELIEHIQRYWVIYERGRPDEMRACISVCEADADALRGGPSGYAWRIAAALLRAEVGDIQEAEEEFIRLADEFGDCARDAVWLPVATLLAELCTKTPGQQRAEMLYRELLTYAGRVVVIDRGWVYRGVVEYYLAPLAAAIDDFPAATRHWENALAHSEAVGAQPFLARTQYAYARALWRRGRADHQQAEDLAARALGCADSLGMAGVASQVRALVRYGGESGSLPGW